MKIREDFPNEAESFDVNVIPLIDVLLVLLIFFMVSASFVASGGLDVQLPKASSSQDQKNANQVIVTLTDSGDVLLDEKRIGPESLREGLAEIARREPKPLLVLRADERVHHGKVVAVLDEARGLGLSQVAIAAVPQK